MSPETAAPHTALPRHTAATPRHAPGRRPGRWKKPLLHAVMVVLAIPFVFPTWWMITSSLLPENEVLGYPPKLLPLHPQWSNYRTAFADYPLAHQDLNILY